MAKIGKCPCGAKLAVPEGPIAEGTSLKCGACGRVLKLKATPATPAAAPPPSPPAPKPEPEPEPEPAAAPPEEDLGLELEDDEPLRLEDDDLDAYEGEADEDEEDDSGETIQTEPSGPGIGGGGLDEQHISDDGPGVIEDTEDSFEVSVGGHDKDDAEEPQLAVGAPATESASDASSKPAGTCPGCGQAIEMGAVLCVHCGLHLESGAKIDVKVEDSEPKSAFWDEFKREMADKWKTWGCVFMILGAILIIMLLMKIF